MKGKKTPVKNRIKKKIITHGKHGNTSYSIQDAKPSLSEIVSCGRLMNGKPVYWQ